jgi:MFS family permease
MKFNVVKGIPRTVLALGVASFFTDLSSEMIYPLLPVFLAGTLGAGPMALGIIEGVAESTASILKLVSGIWTDRTHRRKPLILLGYSLSGSMRPLIGLAGSWLTVLFLRVSDRVGKGIRTSPRDALIADVTHENTRGSAYGLHRAMDHAGAVIGPLIGAALLTLPGMTMRGVFLWAFVPAALVIVILVFFVREPEIKADEVRSGQVGLGHWSELSSDFKRMLLALLIFMLGNSTDAFLLLKLANTGIEEAWIAVLWSLHHVVKMSSTYFGGWISDFTGRKLPVQVGWSLYAAAYLGFGFIETPWAVIALFMLYGVHFGLTEPTERAWVSDLVPPRLRGTAFGYYHLTIGIGALPASLLFGFLWNTFGMEAAFVTGAVLAGCGAAILASVPPGHHRPRKEIKHASDAAKLPSAD